MTLSHPRVISVREGHVLPTGSWLYVWVDVRTGAIAYVGSTGFDPQLRAYLHITSEDPQVGGVRATVPRYADRDFDVLAFELPLGVDRQAAKAALVAHLSGPDGEAAELRHVTAPIMQALDEHRALDGGRVRR